MDDFRIRPYTKKELALRYLFFLFYDVFLEGAKRKNQFNDYNTLNLKRNG